MKITLKDLKDKGVCSGEKKWFIKSFGKDSEIDIEDLINKLIEKKQYETLYWVLETFKFTGEYVEYWSNGNIRIKQSYNGGLLDGESVEYYRDGEIYVKCSYEKGKRIYGEISGNWSK